MLQYHAKISKQIQVAFCWLESTHTPQNDAWLNLSKVSPQVIWQLVQQTYH